MLIKGLTFVDVQFGMSAIKFMSSGASMCGVRDIDPEKVITTHHSCVSSGVGGSRGFHDINEDAKAHLQI